MGLTIAVDCRKAGHGGIGTYVEQLCAALVREASRIDWVAFVSPDSTWNVPPGIRPVIVRSPVFAPSAGLEIGVHLRRMRAALYHATHFHVPPALPCPVVMTLHDLIPLDDPGTRGALTQAWLRRLILHSAPRARVVACVSEATRATALQQWPELAERLRLTPLAASRDFHAEPRSSDDVPCEGPFLLMGPALAPHKNGRAMVRAFQRAVGGSPHRLVCTGASPAETRAAFESHLDEPERLIPVGRVSTARLAALYRRASGLLFASLREGFGLPILEAMASGCPVLTSRGGATEEVADGAALLVEPRVPASLEAGVRTLLEGGPPVERLRRAGLARAARSTWAQTARRTLHAYDAALPPHIGPIATAGVAS